MDSVEKRVEERIPELSEVCQNAWTFALLIDEEVRKFMAEWRHGIHWRSASRRSAHKEREMGEKWHIKLRRRTLDALRYLWCLVVGHDHSVEHEYRICRDCGKRYRVNEPCGPEF